MWLLCFQSFLHHPWSQGLIGKALARRIAEVHLTNPRDFTTDKHQRVDDEPYGGGVGMLMKPDPIFAAVESLPNLATSGGDFTHPPGETMKQVLFRKLAM
jgi:tRNA (guanine37-N1)-methyltransferase